MNLDRTALLARTDLTRKEVTLPDGDTVFVRVMTGTERDRFESVQVKEVMRDFRARVAAATVCDESGALLFTDSDVASLGKLPAATLDPIVKAALELNAVAKEDVESAEKN